MSFFAREAGIPVRKRKSRPKLFSASSCADSPPGFIFCGRWDLSAEPRAPFADSSRLLVLRVFVAPLFGFLLLIEGFCLDREEGSQGEIENGEYHPDHQPHDAADQ